MFYPLVAFIALTTIKQWNLLFNTPAKVHCSYDFCLTTYEHRYWNTTICAMDENLFLNLNQSLQNNCMTSIWNFYYIGTGYRTDNISLMTSNVADMTYNTAGRMTHNTAGLMTYTTAGLMTHNTAGRMTHKMTGCMIHKIAAYKTEHTLIHNTAGCMTQKIAAYETEHVSIIPCSYCLMPYFITSLPVSHFCKPDHNVMTSCGMENKTYPSCLYHHIIKFTAPYNLSEKTGNHTAIFKEQCSKPVSIFIYFLRRKGQSNSQFDQKLHNHYKCPALRPLPLFLAINRCIYYLLNSTFINHADDVKHLIDKLLLKLQQYVTRRNNYKQHWIILLFSGLLSSQHISLWFLFLFFWRIHIVAWKLSWFQNLIFNMNRAINIIMVLSTSSYIQYLGTGITFITFCCPIISLVSDWSTKSTTGFTGGGRSARTDYEFLKPYVISTEVELKNPAEFSYVYGVHCTLYKAIKEIQTSGEARLVCNIPLALVVKTLTLSQADEVAKEHNIHGLSRKSLPEKQMAVESHACTNICNGCVTMFKPVKKKPKEY